MLSQTKQDKQTERKHKSVPVPPQTLKALKKLVATYPSLEVAAEEIGLNDRFILARVMKQGTCSSDTLSIILSKISVEANAA